MRDIGIGLELEDGRVFTTYMPIDLHDNWKDWFFPLSLFKNEVGTLDTTQIKSVLFTSLDEGKGSFTIDNITVGGTEYEEIPEFTVSDDTEDEHMTWTAWEDNESENPDSFTVTQRGTGDGIKFTYTCPEGSYGGQARAVIPKSWDIGDATYFTFRAKGDGSQQRFMLRFEQEKGTNQNEQRSNFQKRELERFCISFDVNSDEWQTYKFKISDLGISEMLHLDKVRYISLFNLVLESSGELMIDDFAFTNIEEPLEEKYVRHPEPEKKPVTGELETKYPDGAIVQIPKTFEVEAGVEEHISIHIMNKSDRDISGELKIEGLPVDGVENALYMVYAGWSSYPHYPWRNYSYSNFAFTIPEDKKGEYTITVSDASGNGITPQTYKLIVK